MSGGTNFFATGWDIVDVNAYDHVLFVVALCKAYRLSQWRQIVIIITAFGAQRHPLLVCPGLDSIVSGPR